jgi:excisionase family DNA binding protein
MEQSADKGGEKMNVIIEVPKETFLLTRSDLKEALQDLIQEVIEEREGEPIMTIKETAKFLKVSIPTVRSLLAEREIPFFQRGQVIRLNRKDVLEWMRQHPEG